MTRWPSQRRLREEAEFQKGVPWGWIRFKCRGCGADYLTRSQLIYDPCGNCGTHVGDIRRMVVSR